VKTTYVSEEADTLLIILERLNKIATNSSETSLILSVEHVGYPEYTTPHIAQSRLGFFNFFFKFWFVRILALWPLLAYCGSLE
jgi:hypothetical protein